MPSGENPFAYDPNSGNEEIGLWGHVAVGVGLTLVVVGILAVANDASEQVTHGTENLGGSGADDNQIPADPDEGYINPLDNPFGPEWAEDEALDPTYGRILTDPDQEGGEGGKDFDPEAELAREILTDPEEAAKAYTAGQVQEAAEFGVVSTTTPVEPEPEFMFSFGGQPDLGGGEDFTGTMDGDQVFDADLHQVEEGGVVEIEDDDASVVDHKADDFHTEEGAYDFF